MKYRALKYKTETTIYTYKLGQMVKTPRLYNLIGFYIIILEKSSQNELIIELLNEYLKIF